MVQKVAIRSPLWEWAKEFAESEEMSVKDVVERAIEAFRAMQESESEDEDSSSDSQEEPEEGVLQRIEAKLNQLLGKKGERMTKELSELTESESEEGDEEA